MENDLLSIIIPVYNTAKYLDRCLESVLKQTYRSLEIICVDDGSTDNSFQILQEFGAIDKRFRIYQHEKNLGLLKTRRTGVEKSNGKFILFLDSDDTFDPDLCREVSEIVFSNNIDIIEIPIRQISTENTCIQYTNPICEVVNNADILLNTYVTRKISTSLCAKIYNSQLCKKAFSFIPDIYCYIGEDILTSFFLAHNATSYMGIKTKSNYNYYLGNGISSEIDMPVEKFRKYCEMNQFHEIVKKFLNEQSPNENSNKALEHMSIRLIFDCAKYYTMVPDEDKSKASDIFLKSWLENPSFPQSVMYTFDYFGSTINEIKNSESYKIGNFFVRLFTKTRRGFSPFL